MNSKYSKIFKLGTIIFLAACLGVVIYTSIANQKNEKPINDKVVVACPYSDKSFCLTENTIKKYVLAGNYSNVLENQDPAAGADAYQVQKGGQLLLMTRNNYINFFREYDALHGPFSFDNEVGQDGGVVMNFKSKDGADSLVIMFKKVGDTWHLVYPIVRQ